MTRKLCKVNWYKPCALAAPQVNGWTPAVHKRFPFSPEGSRKPLAAAGYPKGFEVDTACPNNRYINDEEICQAITAMWARVGVRAKLRTLPPGDLFPDDSALRSQHLHVGLGLADFRPAI